MECVVEMESRAKLWRVCSRNNSSIAQVRAIHLQISMVKCQNDMPKINLR